MPLVAVRGGDHTGHGRVVFDWPQPTRYQVEERGEGRVMLRFAEPAEFDLAMVSRGVRNLAGIEAAGQDATLATRPGVRVRHFRLGGRVVVDLLDPAAIVQAAAEPPPRGRLGAREAEPAERVRLAQAAPGLPGRPALPPIEAQPAPEPRPAQVPGAPVPTQLRLEAGTGRLVALPGQAATVMAADPRVARVQPASPTSVFIMAVANGRTTVIATSEIGQPVAEFDITVFGGRAERAERGERPEGGEARTQRPLNAGQIESQIRTLIGSPGRIRVRVAGRVVHLSGTVGSAADARRAEAIARGMGNEDTEVVNEIAVLSSIQVNLRVRVAEISRDVTRQFGFNWQAIGSSGNFLFGLRSGASSGFLANTILGPAAAAGGTLSSPQRIGAGYRSGSTDVNGLIDALAADNLISILAEPNLTAQSGETASFLAGGEFPVPVATQNDRVTIEFKQFGVSLAFVPTVIDNGRISLRVRPEVSELTEDGAISLPVAGGVVRIPALRVRRAETTVELGSGQSFAIAGLLQDGARMTGSGFPYISELPVIGALFRSDRFRRNETELVIIITPYLVQPVADPRALRLPTDGFRPANDIERILLNRQISRTTPPPRVPGQAGFILE